MENLEELLKREKILREKFHKNRPFYGGPNEELIKTILDLVMDQSAFIRLLKDKRAVSNEEIITYRIKIFEAALKKEEGFEDKNNPSN